MMFEQCKIVIFKNIILMKKHWKIFWKNSKEIFRNFPEKYEIFRTNFPPHITIPTCAVATVGFEPMTLSSKGFDSTNVPPRPTLIVTNITMISGLKDLCNHLA